MKLQTFLWFLVGFTIGYVTDRLTSLDPVEIEPIDILDDKPADMSVPINVDDVKNIRILCILNTMSTDHSNRVVHIMETYGKHCDKMLFMSTVTDVNLGAIGFNVTSDSEDVWGKVKLMMTHIYKNYLDEYDWFIKGDDQMFLIPENLRFLLSPYSTEDPIYFGYKFNTSEHKRGYFSGGSGYAMNRKTLQIFVENVLKTGKFFNEKDSNEGCHLESDKRIEDWEISVCLDYYNVYAGDSRDSFKRERFLLFWPEFHLHTQPDRNFWYWQRKYYWTDEGLDCCSNYTISFHYISAQYQYTMYFLTYRLQSFGVEKRFPPPPVKKRLYGG